MHRTAALAILFVLTTPAAAQVTGVFGSSAPQCHFLQRVGGDGLARIDDAR